MLIPILKELIQSTISSEIDLIVSYNREMKILYKDELKVNL